MRLDHWKITREHFGDFFRQTDLVQNFHGSFMIFGDFGQHIEIGQLKDACKTTPLNINVFVILYYLEVSLILVIKSQLIATLHQYAINVLNGWYENTNREMLVIRGVTQKKMKLSIRDFFSKCDQICSFLRIWSDLLRKSLMGNFIFCAVRVNYFHKTKDVWQDSKYPSGNLSRPNQWNNWSPHEKNENLANFLIL